MSKDKGGKSDVISLYLSRAGRHRILSLKEEAALSAPICEGDEAAWEELVRHNLRLVVSVARRYVGRGLELSDLIQEGNLALTPAAWGFDANYDTKFSTYATWWIKQSIRRATAYKASLIRLPIRTAEEERVSDNLGSNLQTKVVKARVSAGRRVRITLAVKNYEQNVLRAATVQQPRRITGKLGKGFAQRISLFAGVLQTLEISCKVLCFSNKEEVPGSSLGPATYIF